MSAPVPCRLGVSSSPPQESPTDAELWQAMGTGGDREAALAVIYDRYAGLVYGIGLRILPQPQEAEDLVQEVFAGLCERSDYDPSRGSLGTFLGILARSRAIDRLRRRTRRGRLREDLRRAALPELDRDSPLERTSTMESARHVSEALAQLPERQRQALELAYYQGLTQTEIAGELGAPLGTVKSLVRAALRRLRDSLGHLVE